jgi:hypothetical protein
VELEHGGIFPGGFPGADVLGINASAAHAGEPEVERLAVTRGELLGGHELGLGVGGVELLERGGPVGVVVSRAGIEAGVGFELGEGFVD